MASDKRAVSCPDCQSQRFREEKIVELDASVVVRVDLPIAARTVREMYRYICVNCGKVLDQPWTGHHENGQ